MKKYKPECPFCRRKLTLSETFKIKTYGQYVCPDCKQMLDVRVSDKLQKLATATAVVVVLLLVIFSLFIREYLIGAMLVLLIFIVFYLQVPRFISLKETKIDINAKSK